MSSVTGILEGVTYAAGEALNQFGGIRSTRLSRQANVGDTSIHVERSYGLPDAGSIAIDGIPYSYADVSASTLTGISYTHGGRPVQGIAAVHQLGAQVTDISGTYSSLDLVKKALFVDSAEGSDLSTLARNLGVLRIPALSDDAQFRALVKVLAYNPRGTIYGLQLVLDALIGAGNYSITEDLLAAPCQVTVTLPGALFLNALSAGKAFLSAPSIGQASGGTLASTGIGTYISSVRQPAEAWQINCQTRAPDLFQDRPFDGAPYQTLLPYTGDRSGIQFSGEIYDSSLQTVSPFTVFNRITGYFRRDCAMSSAAQASLTMTLNYDGQQSSDGGDARAFSILFGDGKKEIAVGVMPAQEGAGASISIMSPDATSISLGNSVGLNGNETYHVTILKNGNTDFELIVDGESQQSIDYADAYDSSFSGVIIGNRSDGPGTCYIATDSIALNIAGGDEILNIEASGALQSDSPNLVVSANTFAASDTGHLVTIEGSAARNAQGGTNNGHFLAEYVDAKTITLTLPSGADAQLSAVNPQRIVLGSHPSLFRYPDSLGTTITLTGSTQGNNGVYTIVRLLDPDTFSDYGTFPSTGQKSTNVCEVSAASFVAEQNLSYTLSPNFSTDEDVSFTLSDAASHSVSADGVAHVTPRDISRLPDGAYRVMSNEVLSAQLYQSDDPFVSLLSEGPPSIYSAQPFYVSDPLVFVETYLDGVVAAGVRLNFQFT